MTVRILPPCKDCNVPLYTRPRGSHTPPAGHKKHEGRGYCKACYQRMRRREGYLPPSERIGRTTSTPTEQFNYCRDCDRPMQTGQDRRTNGSRPGHARQHTADLCDTCYKRRRREHAKPPLTIPPLEILDQALCAQTNPEAFFPELGENATTAKRICGKCPIRAACLQWALDNSEPHGIWGGLSPKERAEHKRKKAA